KYSPSARTRFISDALALAEAAATAVNEGDYNENFKAFILEKLTTVFNTINFDSLSFADGDDILESRTKREIVQLYCKLSPDDCTKKLTQQFEANVLAKCSNKSIASVCSRLMYECVNPGKASLHKSDISADRSDERSTGGSEIVSDFILDNWKEVLSGSCGLSAVLENAVSLNSEREIKQFERFLVDHKSSARDLDVLKRQLGNRSQSAALAKDEQESIGRLHGFKTCQERIMKAMHSYIGYLSLYNSQD
ncbi:hypothetical protein OSTOST_24640, partial [Ostertagia ostertagi]